jgi:hypothetical protein
MEAMNALRGLASSIFVGDATWAWRRRMAFAGCGVFLSGILKVI